MRQFKQFKNKKKLIILMLFFISVYIFSLKLIPLIHNYYNLKQIAANKSNMKKLLKVKLINFDHIKLIRFKAGYHQFSTNLLTVLSYINYLRKNGSAIKVKITKNNLKHEGRFYQKSELESKDIDVTIDRISNIGIIFSLLETFRAFPLEMKKISIHSNLGKNINAVINMRLISLKGAR